MVSEIDLTRKAARGKKANRKKGFLTMAKPTSAFFSAGPSLVPSPVTATTCLWSVMVLSIMPVKRTHKQTHTETKQHIRSAHSVQWIQHLEKERQHNPTWYLCHKSMQYVKTSSVHLDRQRLNSEKCLPLTSVCLSVGEDLARTRSLGQTLSIRSCSTWTNTHTNTHKRETEGQVDVV